MSAQPPVAVVTGAARGIGRVVALTLAERGYRVAANDLAEPEATLRELRDAGATALALPGDVSDEETVRGMVRTVVGEFGRADVLVNNAGISHIAPAEETSPEDWRRVLEVNLTGPFLTCREFGKAMLEGGFGSIVNVASVAGLLGIANRAAYNASKHGLIGLTRTLSAEWGGRGVRVNAVCPGWVKTEMDLLLFTHLRFAHVDWRLGIGSVQDPYFSQPPQHVLGEGGDVGLPALPAVAQLVQRLIVVVVAFCQMIVWVRSRGVFLSFAHE